MDLRPFINHKTTQISRAKELIISGLLNYQPFIFSDVLEVGAGYEFIYGEFSGLVYWLDVNPKLLETPELKRFFIKNEDKDQFTAANARLRCMYDNFIDEICNKIGDISKNTFADIGCNSGYFPISFSLRGAKKSVGTDRIDYTETFKLLNEIFGTDSIFIHQSYNGLLHSIQGCEQYDVVISVAVLCHLSDPLQHLSFLGSIVRKAIFIWAPVTDDDDYCIRFGEPNKYYKSDQFPLCFDNKTRPSAKLLRKSFELMGFTEIHEIHNKDNGMPDNFYNCHKAILAVRP
jgi:SAM-dependent methyltransferase